MKTSAMSNVTFIIYIGEKICTTIDIDINLKFQEKHKYQYNTTIDIKMN